MEKIKNTGSGYLMGLLFAFLYSIFTAMKFITIRTIGVNIHSSIKSYYSGVIGTFVMLIANMYFQPTFF